MVTSVLFSTVGLLVFAGASPRVVAHQGNSAVVGPFVVVARNPSCGTCSIRRSLVARVGVDHRVQDAAPSGYMGAITNGDSLIALPVAATGTFPVVIDKAGTHARALGGSGAGPGEYRGPTQIARWRKDSILIVDQPNNRISILDPKLKFARVHGAPAIGVEAMVALNSGEIVTNAALNTPSALGYPLHVYTVRGDLRRSFGVDTPIVRFDRPMEFLRFLASDGQRIWAVPLFGRYEIEEWDPTAGRRIRKIVRQTPDYPNTTEFLTPSPQVPPQSAGVGLFFDEGIVWSLWIVRDKQWKKGLSPKGVPREGGTGLSYAVTDKNKLYDTIVEAFDARTGAFLASARYDEHLIVYFSQGKIATTTRELADGSIVTDFLSFSLVGR